MHPIVAEVVQYVIFIRRNVEEEKVQKPKAKPKQRGTNKEVSTTSAAPPRKTKKKSKKQKEENYTVCHCSWTTVMSRGRILLAHS